MALQLFKIETVEVSSPVTSITFSSIPQGYTDLIIKTSIRSTYASASPGFYLSFNGSTSTFTGKYIQGNSSTVISGSENRYGGQAAGGEATVNTFSNDEIYIPNYTSSNYKSYSSDSVSENNASAAGSAFTTLIAGLWSTTSAITSITIDLPTNRIINTNSTFTLYGIL